MIEIKKKNQNKTNNFSKLVLTILCYRVNTNCIYQTVYQDILKNIPLLY